MLLQGIFKIFMNKMCGKIPDFKSLSHPQEPMSSLLHQRVMGIMMKSSNGNIFHIIGHLCREFTGDRWIPRTKASDAELLCFLCHNKGLCKQSWGWWFEMPSHSLWRHCNVKSHDKEVCSQMMPSYIFHAFIVTSHDDQGFSIQLPLPLNCLFKSLLRPTRLTSSKLHIIGSLYRWIPTTKGYLCIKCFHIMTACEILCNISWLCSDCVLRICSS